MSDPRFRIAITPQEPNPRRFGSCNHVRVCPHNTERVRVPHRARLAAAGTMHVNDPMFAVKKGLTACP
jgi:hypothetical protein